MHEIVVNIRDLFEDALSKFDTAQDKKDLVDTIIDGCIEKDMTPEMLEAMSQLLVTYYVLYNKSEKNLSILESLLLKETNE